MSPAPVGSAGRGLRLYEHGENIRLLVEQLSGRFRVKNPTLQRLHTEARKLLSGFARPSIEHIRRESNKEADGAANEGVDAWLAGEGADYVPPDPAPRLWE